jgi:hypothetical protein
MNTSITPSLRQSGTRGLAKYSIALLAVCGYLTFCLPVDSDAKVKLPRAPRPEPELKIVGLDIAPIPYTTGNGPLQFSVTVQLPRAVERDMIVEVTSLISSPSKTSLRFLTHRQPVRMSSAANGESERSRISVELAWDGQDHRKQLAGMGTYSYEVRTKLLANGERGLRTVMVAWPKRGTLKVN